MEVYYGNVILKREYCKKCKQYAFIEDGEYVCCGNPMKKETKEKVSMSQPCQKRQHIRKRDKREILEKQGNKCIYCEYEFGSVVMRGVRTFILHPHFDHFIPFAYNQNNKVNNMYAACQICNSFKSNIMLSNIANARAFIKKRWITKKYRCVI